MATLKVSAETGDVPLNLLVRRFKYVFLTLLPVFWSLFLLWPQRTAADSTCVPPPGTQALLVTLPSGTAAKVVAKMSVPVNSVSGSYLPGVGDID